MSVPILARNMICALSVVMVLIILRLPFPFAYYASARFAYIPDFGHLCSQKPKAKAVLGLLVGVFLSGIAVCFWTDRPGADTIS